MNKYIKVLDNFTVLTLLFTVTLNAYSAPLPPTNNRTDLALGKKVSFAPKPFKKTKKHDATDLTDGKISKRKDNKLWLDDAAVTWYEAGLVNLKLNLGNQCQIDEVAMRFNGTSIRMGSFPRWVEVVVSNDEKHYRRVAEFSSFRKGDLKKFHIPIDKKGVWIHCLRFKNLDVTGRYVGLRFYGNNKTASDELYVFGKKKGRGTRNKGLTEKNTASTGFTVKHAQVYFHKPYLKLATNLALPVPIGMTTPDSKEMDKDVTLTLKVPKGVKLESGRIDHTRVAKAKIKTLENGTEVYRFKIKNPNTTKNIGYHTYGRLFLQAKGWQDGQSGKLLYSFSQGDWNSGELSIPINAVTVPKAPQLNKIMAGMGWWLARSNLDWPDVFHAYRTLGLNTFNMFTYYLRNKYPNGRTWKFLKEAQSKGFKTSAIAMPFWRMVQLDSKKYPGFHHIYKDGKVSHSTRRWCMSYRGKYYQQAIQRYARAIARIKPDFSSEDIEPWFRGTSSYYYGKCLRCNKSFKESGFSSWDTWMIAQGNEMWKDMVDAVHKELKSKNINIEYKTGLFGAKYSEPYQNVWSVKTLYPKYMDSSQPSYYSALLPADLVYIGDMVRRGRLALGKSDVMPWISPGDAGTFPGRALKWAALECYANGARGIWFWSNRVWDSEDLIAYNKVIRAIAPVEKIIVNGNLLDQDIQVIEPGRISGMKLNGKIVILVSDYYGNTDGNVKLYIKKPENSVVYDLLSNGKKVTTLNDTQHHLTVDLKGKQARFLEIKTGN